MLSWRSKSDLRLARKASSGDASAWEELTERYGGRIYNLALQFARNTAEAEDLTQDIFLKLYRNLHRYKGNAPLLAWSLRLSRNLCIEHYRRTRLERQSPHFSVEHLADLASGDDPQALATRRQQLEVVHRALGEMGGDMATAVLLRDLQGLSYLEVAAFMEIPMGTLKSRLVRARRELAQRVAQQLERDSPRSSDLMEVGTC